MIRSRFDFEKTLQMACRFIQNNGGGLNYTKLLKLMYLADRDSLKTIERPISGDRFYSLPKGPILSNVYELIKNQVLQEEIQSVWNAHIIKRKYDLFITKNPGTDELSEFEINLIDKLSFQFARYTLGEMIQYCHDNIPEWKDPGSSCEPIREEDILSAVGKRKEEIESIREEIESVEALNDVLGKY
ncbi:SocA family protein [bacterium]|nr:SocA family protein [bacterium]